MPVVRAIFISLLQNIQIQVRRSIILVTMQTDTQTDTQKHSLDSKALINKSLVLVKNFICGKVLKLFYHHDL